MVLSHEPNPKSFRIGLSGAPGVGKSSFIEIFGMNLIHSGHRVAVLAVDPSSSRTGGSILGDKTRMTELSRHDNAFVRPSPARGTLGGVARNTNEAILLCEAAGYDVILVETVGVGQSETMVSDMVDMFVLLVSPGQGDELQGMKKVIVELSDMIVVNKCDGPLESAAKMTQAEYISALKFLKPSPDEWKPPVLRCSSLERQGLVEIWNQMQEYRQKSLSNNSFYTKRGQQQCKWMWSRVVDELMDRLKSDKKTRERVKKLEMLVYNGRMTYGQAADEIIHDFIDDQAALHRN